MEASFGAVGSAIGTTTTLALDSAVAILSFVLGAMTSVIVVRKVAARRPAYWIPLALVSVVLAGVAVK